MGRGRAIQGSACGVTGAVLLLLVSFALCSPRALAGTPSGQVMDFGENIWGQLGNGGTQPSDSSPARVALPGATGAPVQIAASYDHSVVLTSTGQIYTSGVGGLGSGHLFSEFWTPKAITLPGLTGSPVMAAANVGFSLVLSSGGQLYTFGDDDSGQLGQGIVSYEENPTPEAITLPGATGAPVQIAAGREHSLVVTSTGQLYTFGDNNYGQLGNGTGYGADATPEAITLPGATGPVTQVAAGEYHSLALTSTGQLFTFGANGLGQLGTGSSSYEQETPTAIALPGATGSIVQIAAGWEHSLALTSTGQLYTFGNNAYGQLGNGTSDKSPHSTPEAITLPGATGSIAQIAAGREDSLVVTSTGELYTFGSNAYGQLGYGTSDSEPHPVPTLANLPQVLSVAAGSSANYSLVITVAPLTMTTSTLPEGTEGVLYGATATTSGGTLPLNWSATGLPAGLSIDSATGVISGTPTSAGHSTVTLTAVDADGSEVHSIPMTLVINAAPSEGSGTPPGESETPTKGSGPPPRGSETTTKGSGNPPSGPETTTSGSNTPLGSAGGTLVQQTAPLAPVTPSPRSDTLVLPPASGTLEAVTIKNARTTLELTCRGASGQSCTGTAALTAHERLRGKKLLAVLATTHTVGVKTKILTLATSTYILPAGGKATVVLALGAGANSLLATRGTLPATLTLTGAIKATRTLSIRRATRAHRS